MLILSWNVHFQSLSGQFDNIVEAIRSVSPDILTLPEVTTSLADDMAGRLADIGLVHIYWSSTDAPPTAMRSLPPIRSLKRKSYQCVIASRWPVTGRRQPLAPPRVLPGAAGAGHGLRARRARHRRVHRAYPQRFRQWLAKDRHVQRPVGSATPGDRLASHSDRRLQRAEAVPAIRDRSSLSEKRFMRTEVRSSGAGTRSSATSAGESSGPMECVQCLLARRSMVCATPIVTFTALRRPPPSHTTRRRTTRDVSTTPSSQGTSRLRTAATTTKWRKKGLERSFGHVDEA